MNCGHWCSRLLPFSFVLGGVYYVNLGFHVYNVYWLHFQTCVFWHANASYLGQKDVKIHQAMLFSPFQTDLELCVIRLVTQLDRIDNLVFETYSRTVYMWMLNDPPHRPGSSANESHDRYGPYTFATMSCGTDRLWTE